MSSSEENANNNQSRSSVSSLSNSILSTAIRSTIGSLLWNNRFDDAPTYRVTIGKDTSVLKEFLTDFLYGTRRNVFKCIESIIWIGKELEDSTTVFDIRRLVVSAGIPPMIHVWHDNNSFDEGVVSVVKTSSPSVYLSRPLSSVLETRTYVYEFCQR